MSTLKDLFNLPPVIGSETYLPAPNDPYPSLPPICVFRDILGANNGEFPEITGLESEQFPNKIIKVPDDHIFNFWLGWLARIYGIPKPNLYWVPEYADNAFALPTSGSIVLTGDVKNMAATFESITHEFAHGLRPGPYLEKSRDERMMDEKFCDAMARKFYIDGLPKPDTVGVFTRYLSQHLSKSNNGWSDSVQRKGAINFLLAVESSKDSHPSYGHRIGSALSFDTEWDKYLEHARGQSHAQYAHALLAYATYEMTAPTKILHIA